LFGEHRNNWPGDHDGTCANPMTTHRTIDVSANPKNVDNVFYQCAPGGDNAKAHVMTSVNTEGYVIAWFSPKQTFTDVHRVCWDQNFTELGGGKWTTVTFLTPGEYQGKTDLAYNDPTFADPNGPSVTNGVSGFGVETGNGGVHAWQNDAFAGSMPGQDNGADKATRTTTCIVDNDNGTLTVDQGTHHGTIAGSIPNGPIRVVFNDDNYNPDKHCTSGSKPTIACPSPDGNGAQAPNTLYGYTWHWDNIEIS
jgi:hypothetical protein